MNSIRIPPVIGRPKRRRWPWVILLVVVLLPFLFLGLLGVGVASLFHLSSDTRALRNSLVQSSGADWQPHLGFHAGGFTLSAARAGLSFLDLEPEARAALRSARGVEVSVSRVQGDACIVDRGGMLAAADDCMTARGWDRVVAAKQGGNLVAVYVPRQCDSTRRVQSSLVVFTGRELVVVSAKANLAPLIECVLERPEFNVRAKEMVQR